MWRSTLVLLVVLLPSDKALAFKPVPPKRHDVTSANSQFILDVDPQAERLTVFAAGKRDQPLWSFDSPVGLGEHFLSNDGKVVAMVTWRFVQIDGIDKDVAVEFWDQTGKIREHTVAQLCPHPARYFLEPGPVGDFWRKWYSLADNDGATLRVRTTDEFEYVFAMNDGQILQTTRIGHPWWLWWAMMALGLGAIAALLVFWRQARKTGASGPAPESGGM